MRRRNAATGMRYDAVGRRGEQARCPTLAGTNHSPDPTKLLNPVAIVLDGSQRPTAASTGRRRR